MTRGTDSPLLRSRMQSRSWNRSMEKSENESITASSWKDSDHLTSVCQTKGQPGRPYAQGTIRRHIEQISLSEVYNGHGY